MGSPPAFLPDRGVVAVSGPDSRTLLNDLITAGIADLQPGQARLSALLSPQGKILFDFLIVCDGADSFLFDTAAAIAPDLVKRLMFYRLRAKMEIVDHTPERGVAVIGDDDPSIQGLTYADPRLPELGRRIIAPRAVLEALPAQGGVAEAWHARRIGLGIPEGGRDFAFGDAFPHEACMDQLDGVDFKKGCYVGQEVVSRMEHRGTARTRVVPVRLEGNATPGTDVEAAGKPAGRLGSVAGDRAIAMLRLDRVADALEAGSPVTAGSARVFIEKPAWARFPFPGEPGFGVRPA